LTAEDRNNGFLHAFQKAKERLNVQSNRFGVKNTLRNI